MNLKLNKCIGFLDDILKTGKSIRETLKENGYAESYIRDAKRCNRSDEDMDLWEEFDTKYAKVLENRTNKLSSKNIDISEEYDKRSHWLVNRDINGKIIDYSYEIYIRDEEPFKGKLSREQVEKIYDLYCHSKLTVSSVSQEFPTLTFIDFKRILRCFNITKESGTPFAPHLLEEIDETKLAELTLKNKAKNTLKKIIETKQSFTENELKNIQKELFELNDHRKWIEEIVDKYYNKQEIEFQSEFSFQGHKEICYMAFADIHYGKKFDNPVFGRPYNKEIAHERMIQIAQKTIEYIQFKKLKGLWIAFLGDMFESVSPMGMRREHTASMDVKGVDQLFYGIDSQIIFLNVLRSTLGNDFPISITYIGGNHDRIGDNRDDDPERSGSLIAYTVIQRHFSNDEFMRIVVPRNPIFTETVPGSDLCIISHHGDSGLMKRTGSEIVNLFGIGTTGYHLVLNGHWHSTKINFESGTNYMSLSLPSVCSTDEYILNNLGKNQLPGFVLGVSENGGFSFTSEVLY